MPLNNRKVISILLEQSAEIEERCVGYREEIRNVISDILGHERDHRISATKIQKRINDKCNAAAQFLSKQLGQDTGTEKLES